MGSDPMDAHGKSHCAYALAPWGMQPNTSHDESLVLYHLSSDSTYYTTFSELGVEELRVEELAGAGTFQDALK